MQRSTDLQARLQTVRGQGYVFVPHLERMA